MARHTGLEPPPRQTQWIIGRLARPCACWGSETGDYDGKTAVLVAPRKAAFKQMGAEKASCSRLRLATFFQSHPDQFDRFVARVHGFMLFTQADCTDPTSGTVRPVAGTGLIAIARRPVAALQVDEDLVRRMGVHALPLARRKGESLDDHLVVFQEHPARDVGITLFA